MDRARLLGGGSIAAMACLPFGPRICFAPEDGGGSGAGNDINTLVADLKKAAEDVKGIKDQVMKAAETANTEIKNLGKITEETKTKFDEVFKKQNELQARFDELEQKLARQRGAGNDVEQAKTMGQAFIDDPAFKAFDSSARGTVRVKMSRKDIMNVTASVGAGASAGTSLVPGDRFAGIIMPPERQMTVRDLLAPGNTSSNSYEYAQETGFTNNAAVVSEGATKPKSDLVFNLVTAPVRTIAHIFKASRQILDDAPALRSYIDARARYGLRYAEEAELLNGDGTGMHLHGLIPQATAYSAAFSPTAPQNIDKIRLAMLQVVLAEFPPTGIVLNPVDWARIQLTKDGENRYLIGNPQDGNTPRLWNLPVVETQAMSVDDFLVGAFRMAAQILDRMEVEVLLSTENATDFEKNMVTIRAEERLALAVYRPEALVYGDFGNVSG